MKWNLGDILKESEFEEKYREVEVGMEKFREELRELDPKMPGDRFKQIIENSEEQEEMLLRVAYLPELMESVDQKDPKAKLWKSKSENLMIKAAEINRKLSQWMKGKEVEGLEKLDDDNAKRLFKAAGDLEYKLNYLRLSARYTLGEKEENIITNKDVNGVDQLLSLRDLIETGIEYKLGKKIIKTQAELTKYFYSTKAKERKEAYEALLRAHKEQLDKFFLIYQAIVKDWGYEAKLRGYETPIAMRNFANQISDKTVATLLEVCQEKRKVFWPYFEWKAKKLGIKKLRRYDIYAPMGKEIKKQIDFKEAKKLVVEALKNFSPSFGEKAEKILNENHVDVYPQKNKISGAFCATVGPKVTPFVLTNFNGTERDISTLAHELGHGIHSLYANKHSVSTQRANLPLAETASTLAEMIVFEKMYREEKDKKRKEEMVAAKIGDAYATILRQNYFIIFEKMAHEVLVKGITAEDLSKMYFETLKEQFGGKVEIDPMFKYEWAYVGHMVQSPFYCYAYNFGELLSYALWSRYKKEGKSMIKTIETILIAGGSENPAELLKKIGVNIEDKSFWEGSFEVVRQWINEL